MSDVKQWGLDKMIFGMPIIKQGDDDQSIQGSRIGVSPNDLQIWVDFCVAW